MANKSGLPCPYSSCGSSDAFSYEDEGFGYCHSCGGKYPSRKPMFDWAKGEYPTKGDNTLSFTPKAIQTFKEDPT